MLVQDPPYSKACKVQFYCELCDYMCRQNSFMTIVITCKSIIEIVFFNLTKTIYIQKSNQTYKIGL